MKIRSLAAVTAIVTLTAGLTACGGSSSGGSSGGKSGKIAIGIKYDQPGMGYKDSSGKFSGLDVAVATYVAKELGYPADKIDFKESPSKQREKMLESGTVKMTFATYTINDERKKVISFAGPYFVAGQSVLVRKDSNITSVKDLAGKKVCSVTGSNSVDGLKKQQPNLVPQKYDKYSECASALSDGVIDAVTTDDAILSGYSNQDIYKGKFKLVGGTFSEEPYGVGLKKGDTATCEKVNKAIAKMISDGSWKKAVEDNLGTDYNFNKQLNPPKQDACS